MISKVKLAHFKRFADEEFILDQNIVLAGPNNCGKSTLLQTISVWNLCVQKWRNSRSAETSKAILRTGIPISRKDFTAIPLREMNLLWTNRDTAYSKEEKSGLQGGEPKLAEITLSGRDSSGGEWALSVTLRYNSREQLYIRLTDGHGEPVKEIPPFLAELNIVHVPPFSGIGAEETRYDRGYQNLLIGQGKPGDILRNLLLEVSHDEASWEQLTRHIGHLFGYDLVKPKYQDTDPYIVIEYTSDGTGRKKAFDLASAGSGFHQVLTLLGFLYARPASVLLVDEPDAHEHIILQRQVYDRLRMVAKERKCQLIISTHSEIILADTPAEQILSFYGRPHRLDVDTQRDQVREALKRLSAFDILMAESRRNILYVEDESDFKILAEFARILDHPIRRFFENPFFFPMHGRATGPARGHFFGLKAIWPDIQGIILLDGDNRDLPQHEIKAENLTAFSWKRYEIENYLVHPAALSRYVLEENKGLPLFADAEREKAERYLQGMLPPHALTDPLGDDDYLISVPASKKLLPDFLKEVQISLDKKDYFQIAARLLPTEINSEILDKYDQMAKILLEGMHDKD